MAPTPVMRAFYYGVVAKLPSEDARIMLVKKVIGATTLKSMTASQVEALVLTDREHLEELAEQLTVDGDGKRNSLRLLMAYGLQDKQSEPATLDAKGNQLTPPIIALCDPKIAYNALQELNRMDHEYGEDDKATSSIEGQANRIRRLRQQVLKASEVEAKKRGGIAKKITAGELSRMAEDADV